MPEIKTIAVIGAGAAGLIAAYELKKSGFEFVVYEQRDCIGGIWAFQPLEHIPDIREGLAGIYNPTYPSLRCNLPKCYLSLPGQPLADDVPEFPDHKAVLAHLEHFVSHNNLYPSIRFNHKFQGIEPVSPGKWRVKTEPENHHIFDGVILGSSRYSTPVFPDDIKNLYQFAGKLEHSLSYRGPEFYEGKRVAVLGTGPSGEDLSREISQTASQVFLCAHEGSRKFLLPEKGVYGVGKNITRQLGVVACSGKNLTLENGEELKQIDVFLLCCGYRMSDIGISAFPGIDEKQAPGLPPATYLNIFHPRYPELSIIGLTQLGIPFLLYPYQAKAIAQQLSGQLKLPPEEKRLYAARRAKLYAMGRISFSLKVRLAQKQLKTLTELIGSSSPAKDIYDRVEKTRLHRFRFPETYRDEPLE